MSRQPTFYLPHGGGPCFFMEWEPAGTWDGMRVFLEGVLATLPQAPRAILLVSAHWEAPSFSVNVAERPGLLYDYYGFPEHTYRLSFPAPGAPELASKAQALLEAAGIPTALETQRGWDHGVFVPLLLLTPRADVPVLQLSLKRGLDAGEHLAAGRALSALRDEGVLILASGMSYHDLRRFGPAGGPVSRRFDAWLRETLEGKSGKERSVALENWEDAPSARAAHPRSEHLLPLMVAAGAGLDDAARRVYAEEVHGVALSAFRFG